VSSTVPSPPQPAPVTISARHTVVAGDSLWGIARKYNTSVEAIQSANQLSDTLIRVGETLDIPGN
jgi:LysM repeat protein